ncbi:MULTISPECIES: hypothetical protein [Haloferax]|uniref:Uncharacterized protein n=2 Tax=Haloferax TaxID=2251 RepID=A0A6G1Z4N3_9EURY|nr:MULTISPECIES: hypothetical protein [Haloferax]KAB1188795.1 hypothetical protein Hfx1149_12425 [Haloferax sp. CBA1149]MRW81510.1 hypothetical protein [Haloferax marinisediminis]
MSRRRDAALALVVTVPVVVGVAILRPQATPSLVLLGVFGTLALEAALLRWQSRVRAVWERPRIQVVTVVATLTVVALAVEAVGANILVIVLSALATYLLLLASVELRDRWTGRR